MARKSKGKKEGKKGAPPPPSGAGLITFYQEDIKGIKIRPEYVITAAIMLAVSVILAHLYFVPP
ncbi:MAG: preprotein translocase subunit Sec61beta [Thermofilum sp. ex4484_15]|nr:MAG: preprotein translocase subunit Sec61beta [Thermofilum sp. ex4484_15]